MDCGTSLIKYILFLFNMIVFIAGILGIAYGVIIIQSLGVVEVNGQYGFPPQAIFAIIIISICSVVVIISFCGCCGTIRESVSSVMTYSVFMLILLIVQLIFVLLLYTNKDKIMHAVDEFIDLAWDNDTPESPYFDGIQRSFKCCGKNGPTDYGLKVKLPPPSCCENENCATLKFYEGCRGKIKDFISGNTDYAKHFGIGLMVVELLGFIFGCTLANSIRNDKRRQGY